MNKSLTITTLVTITLLLTLPSWVIAKSEAKIYKGYVVTNSGDKLIGQIQMLSPTLNEIKVKFIGKGNVRRTLKAKEVKEYAFVVQKWNKSEKRYLEDWITYSRKKVQRSPVPFGPTNVLLERPIEGKISMYNHFIEQNTNTESRYTQVIYLEKKSNKLIQISKENYKKVLKKLTSDNIVISRKIGTRGYTFGKIESIIQTYNNWKEDSNDTI